MDGSDDCRIRRKAGALLVTKNGNFTDLNQESFGAIAIQVELVVENIKSTSQASLSAGGGKRMDG